MPRVREVGLNEDNEDYDEEAELLASIHNARNRSQCGGLVIKVNDFLRKPCIEHDLSGVFDCYLKYLRSSDLYTRNGVARTNFGEASLLIQGASQLISKKIDLCWKFVIEYLNQTMSYEEKTDNNRNEFALLEERKEMFQRRRRKVEVEDENAEPVRRKKTFIVEEGTAMLQGMDFKKFTKFVDKVETTHVHKATYEYSKMGKNYTSNWRMHNEKSQKYILDHDIQDGRTRPLEDSMEALLPRHVNTTTYRDGVGVLAWDIHEINTMGELEPLGDYGNSSTVHRINREFESHYRQVHLHNVPEKLVEHDDVHEAVVQRWISERAIRAEQVYAHWEEYLDDCTKCEESQYRLVSTLELDEVVCNYEPPAGGVILDETANTSGLTEEADVPLARLSPSLTNDSGAVDLGVLVQQKCEERRKTLDSDIESGVFDSSSIGTGTPNLDDARLGQRTLSVHSEGIECPSSPTFNIHKEVCDNLTIAEVTGSSDSHLGDTAVNCGCFVNNEHGDETLNREVERIIGGIETTEAKANAESFVKEQIAKQKRIRKTSDMDSDEDEEDFIPKKHRRSTRLMEKKHITAENSDFEHFFSHNYQVDWQEGTVVPLDLPLVDSTCAADDNDPDAHDDELLPDLDFDNMITSTPRPATEDSVHMSFFSREDATPEESSSEANLSSSLCDDPDSAYETHEIADDQSPSFSELMQQEVSTAYKDVREWRQFMMEKLAQNRMHDYDIHEEEIRVIDTIGTVGKSTTFKSLVTGQSTADVSRSFIAMLHLANSGNIELKGMQAGLISNETLAMELLSSELHHEQLDDFSAPSAVAREENLRCMQQSVKRHGYVKMVDKKKPRGS